jgi:hypothetical protein
MENIRKSVDLRRRHLSSCLITCVSMGKSPEIQVIEIRLRIYRGKSVNSFEGLIEVKEQNF